MRAISRPISRLDGAVRAPGDKSCSHRALMMAGLADGVSQIEGLLEGDDVLNTAKAMAACGAQIERDSLRNWRVTGVGAQGLRSPEAVLDVGNSGTGARLLMGLIAGQEITATFDGDESLRKRPMNRVLNPLRQMGVVCESDDGLLPLTLEAAPLDAVEYTTPMASAQVKSCVLLAGLGARGETIVHERQKTRDHTERMLKAFGVISPKRRMVKVVNASLSKADKGSRRLMSSCQVIRPRLRSCWRRDCSSSRARSACSTSWRIPRATA